MERGENFNAEAWKRMICRRQILLDQILTTVHELFLSTSRIDRTIVGTIIEVTLTRELQEYLCINQKV